MRIRDALELLNERWASHYRKTNGASEDASISRDFDAIRYVANQYHKVKFRINDQGSVIFIDQEQEEHFNRVRSILGQGLGR